MKIEIGDIAKSVGESNVVISVNVKYGDEQHCLEYSFDLKYAEMILIDRIDAFLIPLLPWAMMKASLDDKCCITSVLPLSKSLFHQISNFHLAVLSDNISYYGKCKLDMELCEDVPNMGMGVATGISGGIDSSYTIAKYKTYGQNQAYILSHGFFYNMGIYGGYESDSQKMLQKRAESICKSEDIELVNIKTNIVREIYKKAYGPVVPSIIMGGVLNFQKIISVYFMSSGYTAKESYFSEELAEHYDWFNTQNYSTRALRFYSSGLEATRMEKVKFVANTSFTHKYLSVCMNENLFNGNCSRCAKCTETMAELDAIGALDKYSEVFDVNAYVKNPAYYLGYVVMKSWGGEEFCTDIVKEYRKNGKSIPFSAYCGAVKKLILRGFHIKNHKRERVEDFVRQG